MSLMPVRISSISWPVSLFGSIPVCPRATDRVAAVTNCRRCVFYNTQACVLRWPKLSPIVKPDRVAAVTCYRPYTTTRATERVAAVTNYRPYTRHCFGKLSPTGFCVVYGRWPKLSPIYNTQTLVHPSRIPITSLTYPHTIPHISLIYPYNP